MHKEIGFIGQGRMGLALAKNLQQKGFLVHSFDHNKTAQEASLKEGISVHKTQEDLVNALTQTPRVLWIMVPSQSVTDIVRSLIPILQTGDTIIDGGNSFFKNSIERYEDLLSHGIHFIDCGTSGGVDGALYGASLMVGGDEEIVSSHSELFTALSIPNGFARVGGPGCGHFTKMVHNAIEYGMMGSIAEGVNLLHEHAEGLGIDITQALKPFEHGSIIQSSLITWLARSFNAEGYLEHIAGKVPKGETEMEMEYLITHENVKVLEAAVLQRKLTRTNPSFIGTLISAMRSQFGGHDTFKK